MHGHVRPIAKDYEHSVVGRSRDQRAPKPAGSSHAFCGVRPSSLLRGKPLQRSLSIAVRTICSMRRDEQCRAHQRRHANVLDEIIICANQNTDANAPLRIQHGVLLATFDSGMFDYVQFSMTTTHASRHANHIAVEQAPIRSTLEKSDARRYAGAFHCLGDFIDRTTIERLGERYKLAATKVQCIAVSDDAGLGKNHQRDSLKRGIGESRIYVRDVLRRIPAYGDERDCCNLEWRSNVVCRLARESNEESIGPPAIR